MLPTTDSAAASDTLENFVVAYFSGEPAPGAGINLEGALVIPEWGKPGQAS